MLESKEDLPMQYIMWRVCDLLQRLVAAVTTASLGTVSINRRRQKNRTRLLMVELHAAILAMITQMFLVQLE